MGKRPEPYPFSQQVLGVLGLAWSKAGQLESASVGAEHFLWSALQSDTELRSVLARLGPNAVDSFEACLVPRLLPGESPVSSGHLPYSAEMRAALKQARTLADAMHHDRIRVAHLLLALTRVPETPTARILAQSRLDDERFQAAVVDVLSAGGGA